MTKTIVITDRDPNGYITGTKTVNVKWECPTCGSEMGEPTFTNCCTDGYFYSVHVWENPCGHVAKYKDLLLEGSHE